MNLYLRWPSRALPISPAFALSALGLLALALLALTLSACGYHTAGKGNILPDHVKTIAIPAFVNDTQTYKLEQMLTGAVVREFTTRANYKIVSTADDDAHSTTLTGPVISSGCSSGAEV